MSSVVVVSTVVRLVVTRGAEELKLGVSIGVFLGVLVGVLLGRKGERVPLLP